MQGKYNLDEVINREDTNSLKYDFARKRGMPEDVLPLWVADMDFRVCDSILETIQNRIHHGIFGYTDVELEYFEPLKKWMKKKHNWNVEESWLVKTPGIVYALAMAVQAYTNEGDGVLIQSPVYYPFREVIEDNNRKVIDNTLVQDDNGKYLIDFNDFEQKIINNKIKLFILCSPHNPVGRVWSYEELLKIAHICKCHNVIVVSDEIHHDFVYEGNKHYVFANVCEEIQQQVLVCTSPSKTFNIAGLQVSNIFIPNARLRTLFRKKIAASGYSQLNTMGLLACQAAYEQGESWLEEVTAYIRGNMVYLKNFLEERLPQIKMTCPEGTYLAWLDFRSLGLEDEILQDIIINHGKLWLDNGKLFGESGIGFQRINVACPRSVIHQALIQLETGLNIFLDK